MNTSEVEDLQRRLQEAEDTLEAIRSGGVDALVVNGSDQQEIYTLQSTDYTYRMLIESMSEGALTLSPDGIILYCNARFGLMLERPLEQIIGSNLRQFILPSDRSKFVAFFEEVEESSRRELQMSAGSGAILDVVLSAHCISFGNDTPVVSCIVTDLTQLNKAKDEFISLASHQLRTPATAVKQYVGMLLEGFMGDLPLAHRLALQKAYDSNERELLVINDLLRVAQVDAGQVIVRPKLTDMVALCQDVIDGLGVRASLKEVELVLEKTEAGSEATLDPVLMRMVIENLLDNAIKYSHGRSSVRVQLGVDKGDFMLKVLDEGIGIMQEDQSKLFQKFSRIHNVLSIQEGGNGIGLYWVQKIVDLHGGTIRASSNRPQGAVFTITIPDRGLQ